jgi:hypothetical protein
MGAEVLNKTFGTHGTLGTSEPQTPVVARPLLHLR